MSGDCLALLYLLLAVAWCSTGTGTVPLEWQRFTVDNRGAP